MLGLPISVIHIPQHYYLRWNFKNGDYVNWNPNDGTLHKTDITMELFERATEYREKYKSNYFPYQLKPKEVLANYQVVLASNIFEDKPFISAITARQLYLKVFETSYRTIGFNNNFVWIHIMNPELDTYFNFDQLNNLIDQDIAIEKDVNYYDAKACLYALKGDFANAILISDMGLECTVDENGRREKAVAHNLCFNKKEVCRTVK